MKCQKVARKGAEAPDHSEEEPLGCPKEETSYDTVQAKTNILSFGVLLVSFFSLWRYPCTNLGVNKISRHLHIP